MVKIKLADLSTIEITMSQSAKKIIKDNILEKQMHFFEYLRSVRKEFMSGDTQRVSPA